MVYVPGEQIAPEETIEVYTQILKKSKEKKKKIAVSLQHGPALGCTNYAQVCFQVWD